MRRVVCREFGPPERLLVEEAPDPQLHPAAPRTYPLERAADALGERRVTGKLTLLP